ncbi:AraC family transcriptional regulator [Cupriavidus sp. 30B13]|uniref:AraC family transcriptional regulator n=1 Tax=Cupriavidus sp. 30B13 TaxID=3384241 RepID=UPI003B8FA629
MALVSSTELRLSHLRFPFAVRVDALRGSARLRDANARREVVPGKPFVVPAFAYFDCDLLPRAGQETALALRAVPDAACPRMTLGGLPHGQGTTEKYWSRALAGAMFELPRLAWDASLVSTRWQVAPRLVRARLFAEGEALRVLLREQRVAHALYLLATGRGIPGDWLARQAGLPHARALAAACANTVGPAAVRLLEADAPDPLPHGAGFGPAGFHLAA